MSEITSPVGNGKPKLPDTKLVDASFPMSVNGVTFETSMLTDRDIGDLSNWIKAKYIANANNAAKMLDPVDAREIRTLALKEALNIGWMTEEGLAIIYDMEGWGIIHLGWQMCRKRNPRLTEAAFTDIVLRNNGKDKGAWFEQINLAHEFHHPLKIEEDEVGDSGGSLTVSSKSEDNQG